MASLNYRALKLWKLSQNPAFEDSRIQSAIVVGLTVGEVLKLGLRPGGRLPVRVEAQEPHHHPSVLIQQRRDRRSGPRFAFKGDSWRPERQNFLGRDQVPRGEVAEAVGVQVEG